MPPETEKIYALFVEHLNRVHCVKAHLVERLVDIADEDGFAKVRGVINDTIARTEEQIQHLDQLYAATHTKYSFENCTGLVAFLEDAFSSFQVNIHDQELSYILILSYLHHVECIERASVEVLLLLGDKVQGGSLAPVLREVFEDTKQPLIAAVTDLYAVQG